MGMTAKAFVLSSQEEGLYNLYDGVRVLSREVTE